MSAFVRQGVVTLTGSVRFSGEVAVMVGLAANVAGVVDVDDQITYDVVDGH